MNDRWSDGAPVDDIAIGFDSSRANELTDCAECRSSGSMEHGYCQICFALSPSQSVRFSDVIDELRAIAALASSPSSPNTPDIAGACSRAESLLKLLREQFVRDVVLDRPSPVPVG